MAGWLKRMIYARHHRAWHERAFVYVIAGEKIAAFFRHLWIGRNFDFWASLLSLVVAGILFWAGHFSIDLGEKKIEGDILAFGALIGFPILIKRVGEMRLQSRTTQYNAANELLWSEGLGSRMAGIEALWRVAHTYPKEEYHKVMDVFSQFIKHPASYKWEEETKKEDKKAGKRKDISAILGHIGEARMARAEPYDIKLSDTHLEESDLRNAHLTGANLIGAHLAGANLSYAHLDGANLSFSHLDGARLSSAHLERANLMGAYLEGASLWRTHLKGANLVRTNLEVADLSFSHLEGASLSSAHLEGARLWNTFLEGSNLVGVHLEGVYLGGAHLEGADLAIARLEGANLEGAHLAGADLRLTIINKADFSNAKKLTQEQINSCVFITNHTRFKGKPKLPEGFEHTYAQLSFEEWEKAKDRLSF